MSISYAVFCLKKQNNIAMPSVLSRHHHIVVVLSLLLLFFCNDTATTEIYTLSLHDALPISGGRLAQKARSARPSMAMSTASSTQPAPDRKSTRLNSSHMSISYAVFCLKKKKNNKNILNAHEYKIYEYIG